MAETTAGMITEVNYIIVYRVCFWRILPEIFLEEAQYLCVLELSKEELLVSSSLVTTGIKKKLRKVRFVGQGGRCWYFPLSSGEAGVFSLLFSP